MGLLQGPHLIKILLKMPLTAVDNEYFFGEYEKVS
jgi:hypothetical protein